MLALFAALAAGAATAEVKIAEFKVPSFPHDVACTPDGIAWYAGQQSGALGRLDPKTGAVREIPLGKGSAPHGVIVGPDGALWLTDGGRNAILRVDPGTEAVKVLPLPKGTPYANLNTAAFDAKGIVWFTGQSGYYGKADPATGEVKVWQSPKGRGPYGIAATPGGDIYYASLAGSHIAGIDTATGLAQVIEPPNRDQGARRMWSDSKGMIWVSEWNSGYVSRYDPAGKAWKSWKLPGDRPQTYAVYVDEKDMVWVSDWGGDAILRFDPRRETFETFKRSGAAVRQILGCPGVVWTPESGTNTLVSYRY
ncbi:MAG: lyase [Alphaproteobacteria bacterium]|nr:lyase [Alphaproteobacteria bacterium]